MQSKFIRLGILISALWVLFGGYWSYGKNSFDYHDHLTDVKKLCSYLADKDLPESKCIADRMEDFNKLLSEAHYWRDTYFQTFAELLAGLILIWAVTLGLQWALKNQE